MITGAQGFLHSNPSDPSDKNIYVFLPAHTIPVNIFRLKLQILGNSTATITNRFIVKGSILPNKQWYIYLLTISE